MFTTRPITSLLAPDTAPVVNRWRTVPDDYPALVPHGLAGCCQLLPLAADGFAVLGAAGLRAYDAAGRLQWHYAEFVHLALLSPDGRQLLLGQVVPEQYVRLDAATGAVLGTWAAPTDVLPRQAVWLPDGRLLLHTTNEVLVLGPDLREQHRWEPAPAPDEGEVLLTGLVWLPQRPEQVLLADQFGNRLLACALATGRLLAAVPAPGPRLPQPNQLLLTGPDGVALLDPLTLAPRWQLPLPDLAGVRRRSEQEREVMGEMWPAAAWLSPDEAHLLALDAGGWAWLGAPAAGQPPRLLHPDVAGQVLAAAWLDAHRLLLLAADGRVVRLDLRQPAQLAELPDPAPDELAFHRLPPPVRFVGDDELRQALRRLATTPDGFDYAATWQTLASAPPRTDWPALLSPASIGAVLRQYLWYRPESGFDLGVFAELRRALLALSAQLPAAPVAPALALHDQLLATFDYPPELQPNDAENNLDEAWQHLLDWLEAHDASAAAGQPFLDSPAVVALVSIMGEAQRLLYNFISGGMDQAPVPLLAHAAATYPPRFRQRLVALQPGEQCRLLPALRAGYQPAAQRLLRWLSANSPHEAVRRAAQHHLNHPYS